MPSKLRVLIETSRRILISGCLVAAATALVGVSAYAQAGYPSKPIRLVIGYGPGGAADLISRAVAERISAALGQPVVVENRPGAGQAIAASTAARAEPDGHTLFLMTSGHASSVALFKSLPYDIIKDFEPVSTFGFFDIVLITDKSSPFNSVEDLLAAARQAPDKLNIATPAVGSGQHLSAELFKSLSGLPLTLVPFRTSPELASALKGKVVQAAFEMVVPVNTLIQGGELKALAIASKERFPGLPDVPTFGEAGMPQFQVRPWNGLAVPAKTPRAIVDRLNKIVNDALSSPEMIEKFQKMGMTLKGSTPEELKALLVEEIALWEKVVADAKIQKQ
jgi:tripartite-type tricarboxylate transporter receptor subunit TctC